MEIDQDCGTGREKTQGAGGKYIASVTKAVEVLERIASSEDGLGVTEISQQLNFGVSSTYHILNTLKKSKMVEQDKRTKKYRIGFAVFRLSGQAKNQNLLGSLAASHLDRLREELHETALLSVLDGARLVFVAQSEGRRMLRLSSQPGVPIPFYCTAGGKLLVALQPRESWDGPISRIRFEQHTANTILSVGELVDELELTRRRGYGVDNEEREDGVVSVAAPVYDCYGDAVAAVSVSGSAQRFQGRIEEIADKTAGTAASLSAGLGYRLQ